MYLSSMSDIKLSLRELVELSIFASLTFAGKLAMGVIPNVHPVTLMLIVITCMYGAKAFYTAFIYIGLEFCVYGFGIWSISYIYVWPMVVCVVLLFKKNQSVAIWALIAACHGFLFGAMCSIPYIFAGGVDAAISYWVAGIPYDLIHGISNGVLVYFGMMPLQKVLLSIKGRL